MQALNIISGVASILGLVVSIYTFYKVDNLPTVLKQQSREKQLSKEIDLIVRLPEGKEPIPDSTAREVEAIIKTIRLYYVSRMPFRSRNLTTLLSTLEAELKAERQLGVIRHQLQLIRTEITIR